MRRPRNHRRPPRSPRRITGLVAVLCGLGPGAEIARATCVPVPCQGCWIESRGQANLVVLDREDDLISLVPNIRIAGQAEDFGLVVPTPSLPRIESAPRTIWNESLGLTAPVRARVSRDATGFGCGDRRSIAAPNAVATNGVIVHDQLEAGDFIATILSSDDPGALVDWLRTNDYQYSEADSSRFAPFVSRGWFFTAMKLNLPDPGSGRTPPTEWDTNVEPVRFIFTATEFEVPLSLLSINRASWMPMIFVVVDDHRTDLPDFETVYANRVNENEYVEIISDYPNMGGFVRPGRFITRLDRTILPGDELDESILLVRALTDDEFRDVLAGALPGGLVILLGGSLVISLAARMRRRGRMRRLNHRPTH